MKKVLVMMVIVSVAGAVVGTGQPAHALTMCAANWLNSWRATSPETLEGPGWPACCAFARNSQTGSWAVGSTRGGAGAQSVTGISFCSTSAGGTATGNVACPGASSQRCRPEPVITNGQFCWCKMTSPAVGGSWVFRFDFFGSAADCSTFCAHNCADNVRTNATFRAAVLAVP